LAHPSSDTIGVIVHATHTHWHIKTDRQERVAFPSHMPSLLWNVIILCGEKKMRLSGKHTEGEASEGGKK